MATLHGGYPQHKGPDTNFERDYNHSDDKEYRRLRQLAENEFKKRAELSEQSQEAYRNGDGAEAKRLSEKAKEHARRGDQYNGEAAAYVFTANNADSSADEIDLHGLYVKEAIEYLDIRLKEALRRGDSHLNVIVGKGIHSDHGKAKIKPAVIEMCQNNGLNYSIDDENEGVIVISLNGQQNYQGYPQSQNAPGNYHGQQQQQQQEQEQNLFELFTSCFKCFVKCIS